MRLAFICHTCHIFSSLTSFIIKHRIKASLNSLLLSLDSTLRCCVQIVVQMSLEVPKICIRRSHATREAHCSALYHSDPALTGWPLHVTFADSKHHRHLCDEFCWPKPIIFISLWTEFAHSTCDATSAPLYFPFFFLNYPPFAPGSVPQSQPFNSEEDYVLTSLGRAASL